MTSTVTEPEATGNVNKPTKTELLLALALGVQVEDLPARLRAIKGEDSYRQLARRLESGWGVPVGHNWLSKYLREPE